jgi:hypothetical protein
MVGPQQSAAESDLARNATKLIRAAATDECFARMPISFRAWI